MMTEALEDATREIASSEPPVPTEQINDGSLPEAANDADAPTTDDGDTNA